MFGQAKCGQEVQPLILELLVEKTHHFLKVSIINYQDKLSSKGRDQFFFPLWLIFQWNFDVLNLYIHT